jgi:hypothetical protein
VSDVRRHLQNVYASALSGFLVVKRDARMEPNASGKGWRFDA